MCWSYIDTLVSGSPILQNGKLVGAVTYVLINDSATGYGRHNEKKPVLSLASSCVFFRAMLH